MQIEFVYHGSVVEKRADNLARPPPANTTQEVDPMAEFAGMNLKAVKNVARSKGIGDDKLDAADGTDTPRAAVIRLILASREGHCTLPLLKAAPEGQPCEKCGGTGMVNSECCPCHGVVDASVENLDVGDDEDFDTHQVKKSRFSLPSFEWQISPDRIKGTGQGTCISESFKMSGLSFKLLFWPKGRNAETKDKSALRLYLDARCSVTLQAELRINDQVRTMDEGNAVEILAYQDRGWDRFSNLIQDGPAVIGIVFLQLPGKTKLDWPIPGQYELIGVLGRGAYGCVCKARDTDQQRHVAVKEIQNVSKCIVREVGIMAKMDHPCILSILRTFKPPGLNTIYLVMELCDTDLDKVICNDIEVSLPQIRRLGYNLCLGCNYLHSRRIYHRDLKPANCLANRDCSVKICDFNHARVVEEEVGTPLANAAGFIRCAHDGLVRMPTYANRGTKEYASPEFILQVGYTQKTDVWAVGCILVELFRATAKPSIFRRRLFDATKERAKEQHLGQQMSNSWEAGGLLDQMFDVLGTPFDEDFFECLPENIQRRLREYQKRDGFGLAGQIPSHLPREAASLLTQLLNFFPANRLSMREVLDQPFFVDVQKNSDLKEVEAYPLEVAYDESSMGNQNSVHSAMQDVLNDANSVQHHS